MGIDRGRDGHEDFIGRPEEGAEEEDRSPVTEEFPGPTAVVAISRSLEASWSGYSIHSGHVSTHGIPLAPLLSSSSGSEDSISPQSVDAAAVASGGQYQYSIASLTVPGHMDAATDGHFPFHIPAPVPEPVSVLNGAARRQPERDGPSFQINSSGPLGLAVRRTGRSLHVDLNLCDNELDEAHEPAMSSPPRYRRFLFDMEPNNFQLNILSPNQLSHTPIIFYIETKLSQPIFEVSRFFIRVIGPTQSYPVIVITVEEDRYMNRYTCSFLATEPGIHFISVCFGGETNHIDNSPNSLIVTRYEMTLPIKPIMTRRISGRISFDANGLVFSSSSKLWGITSDPDNQKIFAADRGGHEVLVLSTWLGQIVLEAKFDAAVPVEGKQFLPTGIHFCRASKLLYVTDKDNHRVCVFETDGRLVKCFGSYGYLNGQFNYPWGVAVSPDGELIAVADSKNHRVQLFNKFGEFLRKYTVFETNPYEYRDAETGFDYPRGICFNDNGSLLFITDFNLNSLIALDVEGLQSRATLRSSRPFLHPQGIAMDPAGNLLVCDSRSTLGGGSICVFRPGGVLAATLEGTYSRFEMPIDLAVCHGGYICVVDGGGTRLQII